MCSYNGFDYYRAPLITSTYSVAKLHAIILVIKGNAIPQMWKIHWAKHLQFQPHGVFAGILSQYLGQKCLLFSMIKEESLYSAVYYIMNYMYLSSCICCFHKYQAIWRRIRLIQRIGNTNGFYTINVMKGREAMCLISYQDVCHFRTGRYTNRKLPLF